ncbi:MAG: 5-formyltetrahydrofolate cyclo-ligase [Opitutaceae bacterium]|nr:5-formyltetrahydrofolate cyclo-ligase [Verrucomicrobiales bacterium]
MTAAILQQQKARVRADVRRRMDEIPPEHRAIASAALCDRLGTSTLWSRSKSVLMFVPLSDEPNIRPLLELGLEQGKEISIPGYIKASQIYGAFQIRNPVNDLVRGQFNVPEPAPGCPAVALNQLDLILVPGVAFDLDGRRLGRGKGFYDRLLSEVRGICCGLLFEEQLTPEIPVEPHDVRLHCLVTPERWHDVPAGVRY